MATIDINADSFEQTITDNEIVLVDFWADWCGPCKRFAPIYDTASEQHGEITFAKLDTDANQALSGQLGIEGIPTPATHPWEDRNLEHSYTFWALSDGEDSAQGRWAGGPTPDGKGEFVYLADPQALGSEADPAPPASDPMLYATAPEADKKPAVGGPGEAPGGESVLGKLKDKLT